MRVWGYALLSCLAGAMSVGMFADTTFAQVEGDYGLRGKYTIEKGSSNTKYAEDLLDRIVGDEKKSTGIIQTDLDKVNKDEGGFDGVLKISNTLDSARLKLSSYLEWFAFIGLSAAVALIIYNGLMLIFSPLAEDQIAQTKKRLMYITAGALLITGFYFIMKVLLSVLVDIISRS